MGENSDEFDRLVSEAIDIVIRMQNDPANPVPVEMARSWRARSQRHEAIWSRVSGIHGASGQLLEEQRRSQRNVTRRNLIGGALAVAGVAGLGSLTIPGALVRAQADHVTGTGEIRRIELPDGSMATLGPQSAIAMTLTRTERRVELLMGMCFFDVARDRARPFIATADGVEARALGTAFELSSDADIVSMAVAEGTVEAAAPGTAPALHEMLTSGEWLSYDPASATVTRGRREPGEVAGWRDSTIVADRETVTALVARISRWIPGTVVSAHPSIGAQRVSGLYDLRDPLAALEAVVQPTGARVRRLSSGLTVISPI